MFETPFCSHTHTDILYCPTHWWTKRLVDRPTDRPDQLTDRPTDRPDQLTDRPSGGPKSANHCKIQVTLHVTVTSRFMEKRIVGGWQDGGGLVPVLS